LVAQIAPLPQAQTIPHAVTFNLTPASNFQPTAPPILGVFYQIDSWQGPWLTAHGSGNTFTASTANLTSGSHILYTLAADGQIAGATGLASSTVGAINAYVFTVVEGQSSVSLASTADPSEAGQTVTITATATAVSPATGTPTGMMTFMDGATVLARDVPVDANGQASFTTSALATSAHSVQAFYSGDSNVLGSASSALNQTVNRGTAGALLRATPTSPLFGQAVTMTVALSAVSPEAGLPTGTVQFLDGGTPVSAAIPLNSGAATFMTTSLRVGTHQLMVAYSGDSNFEAMQSPVVNEVVGPAILALSAAENSLTIAQGQAGSDALHVTSQGSLSSPVTFACSGLPAMTQCSFSPSSVPASSVPAKVSVTITTTGAQMASLREDHPEQQPGKPLPWSSLGFALPAVVLAAAGARRRQAGMARIVLMAAAAVLLLMLAGCGGGSASSSSGGTQAGTYKVTITASSGSLQSSTPITVTVTQ
jgi:hypothetical protein